MAQIIRRGAGWYSDFRAGKKRIRRFLSGDKREAQIALGKLLLTFRNANLGLPIKDLTWNSWKKRYLDYSLGSKKAMTALRDHSAIHSLEKTLPITRLDDITPELLDRWISRRLQNGIGKQTVNRDLGAIKAMLHKAEGWGLLEPRKWNVVKKQKIARRKLYFYSLSELEHLLTTARGVWRTILMLGARAGLRRGEIYWLSWEDVDFERKRLHICPKDGWDPKDYEQRFIPIPPDLTAHLCAWRAQSGPLWVISDKNGYRPDMRVMTAYMRKLSRKKGLKGALHILRHTYASHLAQAGVSLKAIKDLLGHSGMETTEIYAELAPKTYEDAVSRLPALPNVAGSTLPPLGSSQNHKRVVMSRMQYSHYPTIKPKNRAK